MSETDVWDRLQIDLTEAERRDEWGDLSPTIGYQFTRRRDGTGGVTISEQWSDMDETWSSGISINLPPRILAAFFEWAQSPQPTTDRENG